MDKMLKEYEIQLSLQIAEQEKAKMQKRLRRRLERIDNCINKKTKIVTLLYYHIPRGISRSLEGVKIIGFQ